MDKASCGCNYCPDCLATIFMQALGEGSFTQPQCCGELLPMDLVAPILKAAGFGIHIRTPNVGSNKANNNAKGKRNTGSAFKRDVNATRDSTVNCLICMESFNANNVIKAPCQHPYCKDCMQRLFMEATRNESLYPPKCCDKNIPITVANVVLNTRQQTEFISKGKEFGTKDRVYCSSRQCSAFIPPNRIKGDIGTCSRCIRQTCIHCKERYHMGDCPHDKDIQAVLKTAKEIGWRRCYKCKVLVGLDEGCNHVRCRQVSSLCTKEL